MDIRIGLGSSRQGNTSTPLRRTATKSLGNIGAAARADADRDAAWKNLAATPARQTLLHLRQQVHRTSIGSPSELNPNGTPRDITMASPMPNGAGTPFAPRPRRSLAPLNGQSTHVDKGQSSSGSSQESGVSTDSYSSATSVDNDDTLLAKAIAPTMIPAPVFSYKEHATPAKWGTEDLDLPSPFIRRPVSTAGIQVDYRHSILPDRQSLHMQDFGQSRPREVLGAINPQPTAGPPTGATRKAIPRSKSGNLHQQVLRQNAAMIEKRPSNEGVARRVMPAGPR